MIFYRFKWVRKKLGGKWGHVTALFYGKKWVRLSKESLMWDEQY